MKSKIQMNVAKHMLAVWLVPGDKESLAQAFSTIDTAWPMLSRRVLRVWTKTLYKNPERYRFTALCNKDWNDLSQFFSTEEIGQVRAAAKECSTDSDDVYYIIRSIAHAKFCYQFSTEEAIERGINNYYTCDRLPRTAKPKLLPVKE